MFRIKISYPLNLEVIGKNVMEFKIAICGQLIVNDPLKCVCSNPHSGKHAEPEATQQHTGVIGGSVSSNGLLSESFHDILVKDQLTVHSHCYTRHSGHTITSGQGIC